MSRYIPEFSKLQVYTGDNADGTMKVEDARRPMTMRELMTHSAGLGYVLNQTHPVDRRIQQDAVLNAGAPLQTMIDKLAKVPLLAQPGARWYYSIAVDVQGYLVEKLSGQPFAEFLRTRIFDPIGMRDTAFFVPKEKLARLALVHAEGPDGRTQRRRPGCRRRDRGARGPLRRRRPLLDRGRLPAVRADAPERRRARRRALSSLRAPWR